jgi:Arc/MetJ-type ribon-helix-helix transcriptional regulator
MKRTTISIPDDLATALEREARRRRASASEVVRQALTAYLQMLPDHTRPLPFAALGRSGHRHTARDFEEILAAERDRARDR